MYSCSAVQTSTAIENMFLVWVQIHGVSILAANVERKCLQYLFHHHFFILFFFLQWHEDNVSGISSLSGALIPGNFPTLSVCEKDMPKEEHGTEKAPRFIDLLSFFLLNFVCQQLI